MPEDTDRTGALLDAACAAIREHEEELTALDRAIGDGDHGINMARGFAAIAEQREAVAALPLAAALQKAGMTLVMKVGGAAGPLYGSLLMSMGKALPDGPVGPGELADALAEGVAAVKRRGRSDAGEKTMLDVLVPVLEALRAADPANRAAAAEAARAAAARGLESTRAMRATKGRASFLGERSVGHLDPGARSSALLANAAADVAEAGGVSGGVAIVIVSHSPDVARGAAELVRQMVGDEVRVAWCGGDPGGGLGSDVARIGAAIDEAYGPAGVAVLVDFGGAETNAEMAIEMQPAERRRNIVICDAPVVEGAVMAATEASGGATLDEVRAVAEELSP